jgi:hypothetical protein
VPNKYISRGAVGCAALFAISTTARSITIGSITIGSAAFGFRESIAQASQPPPRLTQDADSGSDEKEVPPEQVEKYIDTYKSMQKNRGMSIDEAASKQGLTLPQFRQLEARIERDDMLRERVRKALQPGAHKTESKESD